MRGPHPCAAGHNGVDSTHPLTGKEIRALQQLRRENLQSRFVFNTERSGRVTRAWFLKMVRRTRELAKLPFPIHPHMLRHGCGFKLANDGVDTRTLQDFLGHRNIMHTVRYTELRSDRFDGLIGGVGTLAAVELCTSTFSPGRSRPSRRRRKRLIECVVSERKTMRLFALALTLSFAASAVASAQTAMPDSENGRYSFNPVADGVLRLDTRTGQVSHCSRSDAGWACRVVPDERSALETEIVRLQAENATLKKELLARGLQVPGVPGQSKPDEPELKLPSDAEVDKVVAFLEKVWRRLVEMGRNVQREIERRY
jgi:hypothetical protein